MRESIVGMDGFVDIANAHLVMCAIKPHSTATLMKDDTLVAR